ncbi:MAG: glycosyltransferase family 4 protein [Chitinispirillaceae bacterium]|nr:glycosyltransferase family 4 protein [Chitinispirillaceae bacterium]
MNIAFFSKHLPSDEPNGVSVQVHRLAQALVLRGHTVTVYTFSPPMAGACYHCITLRQGSAPRPFRKFTPALAFRTVNISGFDVVHFHGDDYLRGGSRHRVRTFYGSAFREAFHAGSIGRFGYQSLFYLFEWISCLRRGKLVALSPDTKRYLPMVKHFIPCCVPLDRFFPRGEKSSQPSILFLGDFNSRKRGALLLDIFSSIILPVHPDCTLTVVGPVSCSGRNIIYAGRLSEEQLIEAYRRSWIFCMPSSYEGFGVPMLEALACGTVVAATHNPGSDALLRNGENGVLCTPEALGAALLRLIADSEERRLLASGGLRFVPPYDAACVALQYEEIYRRCAAGPLR